MKWLTGPKDFEESKDFIWITQEVLKVHLQQRGRDNVNLDLFVEAQLLRIDRQLTPPSAKINVQNLSNIWRKFMFEILFKKSKL